MSKPYVLKDSITAKIAASTTISQTDVFQKINLAEASKKRKRFQYK